MPLRKPKLSKPSRTVGDLQAGDEFQYQGNRYRLLSFEDEGAKIAELAVQTYNVAPGKSASMDIMVAVISVSPATEID